MSGRPTSTISSGSIAGLFLYFGASTLLLLLVSPDGSWLDVATAYILQTQLHASPTDISLFRVLTGIPIYIGFLFGLIRDLWNPFGLRDRGYLIFFGAVTAALFIGLSYGTVSYTALFAGVLAVSMSTRFLLAAQQGLMGLVAQENFMSGRMAALYSACYFVPLIFGALFAGVAADKVSAHVQFLALAVVAALVSLFGLLRPRSVFEHTYVDAQAQGADLRQDLRRLFTDRGAVAAVAMIFLWQFAPGLQTVMQFQLTDQLGAPESSFGYWTALYYASFLPGVVSYGYLCQKFIYGRFGAWAIILSAPLNLVLPELHSATDMMMFSIPLGLSGGLAFAALYDMAIRACPPGLHGALMMAVAGSNQLGWRVGDAFGTWLYTVGGSHGFLLASIATAVTSGIAPVFLLFAPKSILSTRDGERLSMTLD